MLGVPDNLGKPAPSFLKRIALVRGCGKVVDLKEEFED